jgi:hypothetical protein
MALAAAIRRVLLDQWDPLDVRLAPDGQARYDCVVDDLTLLVLGGAPDEDLADCLREHERGRLGLGGADEARLARVVAALRSARP